MKSPRLVPVHARSQQFTPAVHGPLQATCPGHGRKCHGQEKGFPAKRCICKHGSCTCVYIYIYICITLYIQDSFHTNQRFQETELCKQSSSMCHPPASSYDSSKLAWKIEEKHYIWPPFVFFHGINMIENQAHMYCNPWGLRHHHELDHGGHQQTHDSHQLFPITAKH